MVCAGVVNTYRDRVSAMETEIQYMYKRRDEFKTGSKEWELCQTRIKIHFQRLHYLKDVLERLYEETLPEGAWGN